MMGVRGEGVFSPSETTGTGEEKCDHRHSRPACGTRDPFHCPPYTHTIRCRMDTRRAVLLDGKRDWWLLPFVSRPRKTTGLGREVVLAGNGLNLVVIQEQQ